MKNVFKVTHIIFKDDKTYRLTEIPEGTIIDGDSVFAITNIMNYKGKSYFCEILNGRKKV